MVKSGDMLTIELISQALISISLLIVRDPTGQPIPTFWINRKRTVIRYMQTIEVSSYQSQECNDDGALSVAETPTAASLHDWYIYFLPTHFPRPVARENIIDSNQPPYINGVSLRYTLPKLMQPLILISAYVFSLSTAENCYFRKCKSSVWSCKEALHDKVLRGQMQEGSKMKK